MAIGKGHYSVHVIASATSVCNVKKQKPAHLAVAGQSVDMNLVPVIEATGKPVDALATHGPGSSHKRVAAESSAR